MIFDRLSVGIKPPEDIVVKAKLNASKSLMSNNLYKNITKKVDRE